MHIAIMHVFIKFDCNIVMDGRDNDQKLNDDRRTEQG